MPTITLTISEEVKSELEKFSWVNWSEIAKEEFIKQERTRKAFEEFKKIVSKSKLTEEGAKELADKVNSGMHKKYKALYPRLS